ncbi:MAG: riboflavin synthase, partial [Actinobacteria bacterium]
MFSGIIEAFGTIKKINKGQESSVLTLESSLAKELKKGSSIAVNGVCLTVTSIENNSFTLDVMPETISKTDLGDLKIADKVNLERPLAADGRFEGHIVQGHVDATGTITEKKEVENAHEMSIRAPKKILDFC